MRSMKATLAALATVTMLGAGAAQAADPVKIRVSWVAPISNWASIWLEKKDLAKHLGKSYTFEAIRFAGTPPMITALANNEVDIANLAYSTLPIAIQNANLDDLRIISDEFQDGVAGFYTNEYLRAEGRSDQKPADLKGKVVATNAAGSAIDIGSRAMLKKARPRGQARLHGDRGAVPHHARDAGREEGRPDPGRAAVLARSGAQADFAAAVLQPRRARRFAVHHVDRAQAVHRQEPRRDGRLHGGHAAHRALVHRSEEPRRSHGDRRRA